MSATEAWRPASPALSRTAATLSIILLLFAVQGVIRFGAQINHDTAWFIHIANGLLDGKRLYVDFVEVNPPLAIWLIVPSTALARLCGIEPDQGLYGVLFALTAVSLALSARYLRTIAGLNPAARHIALVLLAAVLLFVPGPDFGQREHWMILLFVPWLLLRLARSDGWTPPVAEAVVVGAAAAAAVCLKPHSVLAPMLIEALLLYRTRNWRHALVAENLAAVAFVLLYGAAILIWARPFLDGVLQLGIAAYVPYYGQPVTVLIHRPLAMTLLAAATVWLAPSQARMLPLSCFVAALGFFAGYVLQAKGYAYQLLPVNAACAMVMAFALPPLWQAAGARRIAALAMAAFALVLCNRPQSYNYINGPVERAIDRYDPSARSIFIASTSVLQPFPLVVRRHLQWTSRYPAQWLIPYVSYRWSGGALPDDPVVRQALENTVSDLTAGQPAAIFISIRTDEGYVRGGQFDYLAFYRQDPRFAPFWKDYEKAGSIDGFDVYIRSGG